MQKPTKSGALSGWIDTHSHMTDHAYDQDRAAVIQRMQTADVGAAVSLGIDCASSKLARNLSRIHSSVFYCAGIHPHDADRERASEKLDELEELWSDPKCVAVGEIGLDNFRDYSSPLSQAENFRTQLSAAKRIGKPVVIHNRSTESEILAMLDETKYEGGGIFHCFSGDEQYAREVVARGFHVSFAGNITYDKSTLASVAKSVPLHRLLIETDAPWLTPAPFRKQRNEPSMVAHTGEFLAQLLEMPISELQHQLLRNTIEVFRITGDSK